MDNPFNNGSFGEPNNVFGSDGGFGGPVEPAFGEPGPVAFGGSLDAPPPFGADPAPPLPGNAFGSAPAFPVNEPAPEITTAPGLTGLAGALEAQATLGTVTRACVGSSADQSGKSSGPTLTVTVSDPVEQKSAFSSHITYKINVKTSLPQYQWQEFAQIHRYSDFEWLHTQLKETHPGCVIPPIPPKQSSGNKSPEFVAARRWGLETFLKHCAAQPELKLSRVLQLFLESSSDTMSQTKKAWESEKAANPSIQMAKTFFRSLDPTFHDPELENKKAAVGVDLANLTRLTGNTSALDPAQRSVASALGSVGDWPLLFNNLTCVTAGVACQRHSETQSGKMGRAYGHAAEHYFRVGNAHGEFAQAEREALHMPLEYQQGLYNACLDVFENRKACAMALQGMAADSHKAGADYGRYKDDPSKQGKAQKAQQFLQECQNKLTIQQDEYSKLIGRLPEEVRRFEGEQSGEALAALIQVARVTKMHHERLHIEWSNYLAKLEGELASSV